MCASFITTKCISFITLKITRVKQLCRKLNYELHGECIFTTISFQVCMCWVLMKLVCRADLIAQTYRYNKAMLHSPPPHTKDNKKTPSVCIKLCSIPFAFINHYTKNEKSNIFCWWAIQGGRSHVSPLLPLYLQFILITAERLFSLRREEKGSSQLSLNYCTNFAGFSWTSYQTSPSFESTSGFVYVFQTESPSFLWYSAHGVCQLKLLTWPPLAGNPSPKKRKWCHLAVFSPGADKGAHS